MEPVYRKSREYAVTHDELREYQDSQKRNIRCAESASNTIIRGIDPHKAASSLLRNYGEQRLRHVFSNTVQIMDDGRYTTAAWAACEAQAASWEDRLRFVVLGHPSHVDDLIRESLRLHEEQMAATAMQTAGESQTSTTHYLSFKGEPITEVEQVLVFSPALQDLNHTICLVNGSGEYTDHEDVPSSIQAWVEQVETSHNMLTNLSRFWNEEETVTMYAFGWGCEIHNELSPLDGETYMPLEEQTALVSGKAAALADALPKACIRLVTEGGFRERLILEALFPYPMPAEEISSEADRIHHFFEELTGIGIVAGPEAQDQQLVQ